MNPKKCQIVVNDVLEELNEENNRLFNELLFADKCLKVLIEFKSFVELNSNQFKQNLDENNKQIYEELCENFKQVLDEKSYYSMKLNENNIELKNKEINFDDNQRVVKKSKRKQILRLKSETNDNPIIEETNELLTALSGTVISTNLNLCLIDIHLLANTPQ